MESLIDFARGPLFRLTFAVMTLGLARVLILDIVSAVGAYYRAGDKEMPWGLIISRSLEWLIPIKRVFNNRPVYSVMSILFHIGMLLVPLFLLAHIQLWQSILGFAWPALPELWADVLTISTIVMAVTLFIARVASHSSSFLSRKQDYLWPLLIALPFATGFICANLNLSPTGYQLSMLVHILSAELIFLLMPFTKIAHCVLMPMSQVICTLAWKFPPETDDKVCTTLNKKGAPV